jgi:hypothetical protein
MLAAAGRTLGIAALVLASAMHPASATPATPNALTQPILDGCQRDPSALLAGTSPEWVYVYRDKAPQWVSGIVQSGDPGYQAVHVSGGDLPEGHDAYDFNINIAPDSQYAYLVAGDPATGTGNWSAGEQKGRLHTEWEDTVVPAFAWPQSGDRIQELGSWVWDCGHWGTPSDYTNPDYVLPKTGSGGTNCSAVRNTDQCQPTGESTEFHPYRALWVQRQSSPVSQTGESEADLFISTTKTKAGAEADCALAHPAPAAQPGMGVTYGADYRACLKTDDGWQDVSGQYSFFLPAPAGAAAGATLVARAERVQGLTGDLTTPNAPQPVLATSASPPGVNVTFSVSATRPQPLQMAYRIFAGWTPPPSPPLHLRLTFDHLTINRSMDPACFVNAFGLPAPGCPPALQAESTNDNQLDAIPYWNLYYDVGGVWGTFFRSAQNPVGVFSPADGTDYAGAGAVDFYVPTSGTGAYTWKLITLGRECDLGMLGTFADCPQDRGLATDNDVPGLIERDYSGDPTTWFGPQTASAETRAYDPTSTCPMSNPAGCYTLQYDVEEITGQ